MPVDAMFRIPIVISLIGVYTKCTFLPNLFSESGPPEQAAIYLMDANSTHLTFTVLSPVIPNCSRLSYSVEASSNCGSCPESTTSTAIICTNFTTSVDANITCKLTVGGIICENMPGEKASLLSITLKGWLIVMLLCMHERS